MSMREENIRELHCWDQRVSSPGAQKGIRERRKTSWKQGYCNRFPLGLVLHCTSSLLSSGDAVCPKCGWACPAGWKGTGVTCFQRVQCLGPADSACHLVTLGSAGSHQLPYGLSRQGTLASVHLLKHRISATLSLNPQAQCDLPCVSQVKLGI